MKSRFFSGSLDRSARNTCPALVGRLILGLSGFTQSVLGVDPIITPQSVEPSEADKRSYTLFNPTPRSLMREMSADRPDVTETPYTVDAGHFQLEMDVLRYSYDRHTSARDQVRTETVGIAPMILKLGILNSVDLELGISPYNSIRTHDFASGTVTYDRGFGDLVPRVKFNILGNDGGKVAVALLPSVKIPTSQDNIGNDSVEGGLTVPIAIDLAYGFDLGTDISVSMLRDNSGDGYHAEFLNTLTLARDISGPVAMYVEFVSGLSLEQSAPWTATFNTGLTYQLSPDIRLDGGINIGLTRSAEDLTPFFGITWRF